MKKESVGSLLTVIVMVLLVAMFVYFFLQLNRLDKKLTDASTTVAQNSNQISAIVNFFNANANPNEQN
jgi:flagellar basal body-associated protein FliL